MAKRKRTEDNEKKFEEHFCHQLDVKGRYRVRHDAQLHIDKGLCLYMDDLEEFLEATQGDKLRQLKGEYGAHWHRQIETALRQELAVKPLYQILQKGLTVGMYSFDLVYGPPANDANKEQQRLFGKNRYTAVRQWHFGADTQRESLDIVLLVNGFAIVTIELKNQGTSGSYEEAIEQYLRRDLSLPIFRQPFLHIVCDNATVKMAAAFSDPPTERDFRDFNKDLVNVAPNKREYPVHYLYHDILLPDRLLNILETYLYAGSGNRWMFPRYHQQRATRKVVDDVKDRFKKTGQLDLRYLIQHSTGSGKSSTIVWMVQNLRNAHVDGQPVFDSIVVLTDRINLDDQISKDFRKAILTEGVAQYAESTADLRSALEANKQVIVSTIHKFSHLKELADQSGKRICFLIDEAHRSQEGKLHEGATQTFASDADGVEPEPADQQEDTIKEIARKKFPNMAFVALTATPSDKTLQHFGKKGKDRNGKPANVPFDVYSMDQAIAEGYIMDVAKHIYTYDTLYELNKEVDTEKEYLPMMVKRGLRQKAYEDTAIIREKCQRMVSIFHHESAGKIGGRAKAMVVTSSRLAAVKYKLEMDAELARRGLRYRTLVAFSGTITHEGKSYTEAGMNAPLNPKNEKTEDVFEQGDDIRFLIVANKFQTGYSESLLHTMFLDKPVRDRTAVQTLSRLNRMHPGKDDTLVVDFSGSYEAIMKAYAKYQSDVVSHKDVDPKQLEQLYDALMAAGVFTDKEFTEVVDLHSEKRPDSTAAIVGVVFGIKERFEKELTREQRDNFRTLMNRYLSLFSYVQALFKISPQKLWNMQLFLIYLSHKLNNGDYNSLMKELEEVRVVNYAISEVEKPVVAEPPAGGGGGSGNPSRVRQMRTVKEVIDEINLAFHQQLGDDGMEVVSRFLEVVSKNEELIDMVRNNRHHDPQRVYDEVLHAPLSRVLVSTVMETAPDKYERVTSAPVGPRLMQMAYEVVRGVALAA